MIEFFVALLIVLFAGLFVVLSLPLKEDALPAPDDPITQADSF
ncbi:MAG: hypothetical protein ACPG7F_18900 [Aggregatilineales bacterium]